MPITDCETHGESGCLEMCAHLKDALKGGVFLPYHTLPVYTIRMCSACFSDHRVKEVLDQVRLDKGQVYALRAAAQGLQSIGPDYLFESALLERDHPEVLAEIVRIYGVLNERSGLRCVGCIDQIQLDHARRTQAELPFEPFEHTLLHSEDTRIDALRALVLDHMDPRGNHGQRFYGCTVFSGSVRRPLTLKIYGIEPAQARTQMLARIDGFFEKIPARQRLVQFYGPIQWTEETTAQGTLRTRIPDVLLDEVLVR